MNQIGNNPRGSRQSFLILEAMKMEIGGLAQYLYDDSVPAQKRIATIVGQILAGGQAAENDTGFDFSALTAADASLLTQALLEEFKRTSSVVMDTASKHLSSQGGNREPGPNDYGFMEGLLQFGLSDLINLAGSSKEAEFTDKLLRFLAEVVRNGWMKNSATPDSSETMLAATRFAERSFQKNGLSGLKKIILMTGMADHPENPLTDGLHIQLVTSIARVIENHTSFEKRCAAWRALIAG